MSLDNEQSKVIQGRFHLTRKLGAGSFGEIFEAKDLKTGKLYACKAESLRTKHPQLRLEYQIYRALQNSKSFVRVWGYVTHYNHQIMIMDKLGDSLEQLFTLCGRKFSIRCVCAIAIQILTRIEELHKHNYLHRDIKPDNFLIGHTPNSDLTCKEAGKVYMIDLGLGKVWKEGGRHIPEKHGKRLIGTPRYASINTHFGHEQSRRDDLESLGYMLMYFAHGQLPWQGLRGQTKEEKYQKIGHKKRDTRLSELCAGYPDEFRQYLSATQKLSFQQDPPYDTYRLWFRNVLKRHQSQHSPFDFDWQNRNNHHNPSHKKAHTQKQQRKANKYQQHQAVTPQPHTINKIATNMINNKYGGARHHSSTRYHTHTHNTHTHKAPPPTQYPSNNNIAPPPPPNNNNNPLTLPNLGQPNTNNLAMNQMNLAPPPNNNVPQNQFNNYIDRYQRCRNMQQQQITNNNTNNNALKMNALTRNASGNGNSNAPILQINNNVNVNKQNASNSINNILFQRSNHHRATYNNNNAMNNNNNNKFMTEYQDLVASYKKLEATSMEYKRMLQTSESNYKKLKQKCNTYVYQINDQQQTISKLTAEVNAYRGQVINNPHSSHSHSHSHHQPPAQKRRKLNNGLQRRGSNRL